MQLISARKININTGTHTRARADVAIYMYQSYIPLPCSYPSLVRSFALSPSLLLFLTCVHS